MQQSDENHLQDKTAKCGITIITKLIILEMLFRTIQSKLPVEINRD